MKKIVLTCLITLAIAFTFNTTTVYAETYDLSIKISLGHAVSEGLSLDAAVAAAIAANPLMAANIIAAAYSWLPDPNSLLGEKILIAAILTVGSDSPLISEILNAAFAAGVDADIVTAIAVGSGVDATIASIATAAGSLLSNDSGTSNNNTGGGGGGGGISGGQ